MVTARTITVRKYRTEGVCVQCLWKTERDLNGYSVGNLVGKLRFGSAVGGWDPRTCILAVLVLLPGYIRCSGGWFILTGQMVD